MGETGRRSVGNRKERPKGATMRVSRTQRPLQGSGSRSLPPAVRDEGRRSAGNRKECRLRHDYASFPDSRPLWGLGQSPNVPFIIQKKKVQSQSRPLCGLRLRRVGCANWNDAPSQKRVGCTNLNDAPTASPTNPYALHTTLKYPNCSITDRQVTLRSLTAFSFDRFAI